MTDIYKDLSGSTSGGGVTIPAGDLGGTSSVPTVVSLTGASGAVTIPSGTQLDFVSSVNPGNPYAASGFLRLQYNSSTEQVVLGGVGSTTASYKYIFINADSLLIGEYNKYPTTISANQLTTNASNSNAVQAPTVYIRDTGAANGIVFTTGTTFGMTFDKTVTATIKQADNTTNSATAAALTLQAQSATGTTANGGNFVIGSGTGTTSHGSVLLQVGGTTALTLSQSTILSQLSSTSYYQISTGDHTVSVGAANNKFTLCAANSVAITMSLNSTGTTSQTFAAGVTAATITQANLTTNSATASNFTVQAQNATGTSATGGDFVISPGTGTSANGQINLNNVATTATPPSAGGATIPTALGWFTIKINGTSRKVAYF